MNESFDIFVNRTWLPDIGQLMGPLTPLSPFGMGTPRGDLRGEFTQAGLLDVEGKIGPRFASAFASLQRPTRLARLQYIAPDRELEYQAFTGENGEVVSMVSTEDGYKIRWPAAPGVALNVVSDFAGISSERVIDMALNLPALEARVALALVDATRQAFLMRITAEGEPVVISVKPASLAERLTPEAQHLNRLETLYRELGLPNPTADEGAVRYALASLVTKGLAHEENGEFTANGALLALAGRMLLVSGWFQFDVASGTQEGQISAGCGLVIQAGPRALLLMEHEAGNIRLTGISGEDFVGMVGPLFGVEPGEPSDTEQQIAALEAEAQVEVAPEPTPEPVAVQVPAPEAAPLPEMPPPPTNPKPPTITIPANPTAPPAPPAPAEAAGPKFCMKCGTPRAGESKFCTKCGAPMG